MSIKVSFYSYFRDLTGCAETSEEVPQGTTLNELLNRLGTRFPKLALLRNSMLVAVGVDYQDRGYRLKLGDEVALFPPVQGG